MGEDGWRVAQQPAPVRAQVVEKLRAAITEGVFQPGMRLVERNLALRLEVGRPLVREAIRQLEAEGLIAIVPRRGPTVRALSLPDIDELADISAALESLCARYFAERGTAADLLVLQARLADLEAAYEGGHRPTIIAAKHAFYEAFISGGHSDILQTYLRQLNARVSYLWSSSLDRPGRVAESLDELRRQVAAIAGRDPAAAAEASLTYVQHGRVTGAQALATRCTP